jgi:hypothetical protein
VACSRLRVLSLSHIQCFFRCLWPDENKCAKNSVFCNETGSFDCRVRAATGCETGRDWTDCLHPLGPKGVQIPRRVRVPHRDGKPCRNAHKGPSTASLQHMVEEMGSAQGPDPRTLRLATEALHIDKQCDVLPATLHRSNPPPSTLGGQKDLRLNTVAIKFT